jgi:D-glycero-alpha-D-manno-heptose-7-phosphate kinase
MRIAHEAGAQAGKACGAGGGGCLAFLAEPRRVDAVRAALRQSGAQVIDVQIDWDGVVVTRHP